MANGDTSSPSQTATNLQQIPLELREQIFSYLTDAPCVFRLKTVDAWRNGRRLGGKYYADENYLNYGPYMAVEYKDKVHIVRLPWLDSDIRWLNTQPSLARRHKGIAGPSPDQVWKMPSIADLLPWSMACKAVHIEATTSFFRNTLFDLAYHMSRSRNYRSLNLQSTKLSWLLSRMTRIQCSIGVATHIFRLAAGDLVLQFMIPKGVTKSIRKLTVIGLSLAFDSMTCHKKHFTSAGDATDLCNCEYTSRYEYSVNQLGSLVNSAYHHDLARLVIRRSVSLNQSIDIHFTGGEVRIQVFGISRNKHVLAEQRLLDLLGLKCRSYITFSSTKCDQRNDKKQARAGKCMIQNDVV